MRSRTPLASDASHEDIMAVIARGGAVILPGANPVYRSPAGPAGGSSC